MRGAKPIALISLFAHLANAPAFSETITVTPAGGGGSGSGTVSACSTVGGVAFYAAGGGSTTVGCSTGIKASNTALTLGSGGTLATNPSATNPYNFLTLKTGDSNTPSNFYIAQCGATNAGATRDDESIAIGYNYSSCGQVNASDVSAAWVIEDFFQPGGTPQVEMYAQYFSATGTSRRWIFTTIPANTDEPTINLQGDTIHFNTGDGSTLNWGFDNSGNFNANQSAFTLKVAGTVQADFNNTIGSAWSFIGQNSNDGAVLFTSSSGSSTATARNPSSTGSTEVSVINDINSTLSRSAQFGYTGSAYASAAATNGPVGEQGFQGTTGNFPFTFYQNNTTEFVLATNGLIQIKGITSSFPALKRTGTSLGIRLADDSGDAPLTAANITSSGHVLATGGTPSISSCGTGTPTTSGSDTFGTVVAGTGVLSTCVVNFGTSWGAAPRCVVSSGTAIASLTVTTSQTQLTIGGTSLTSDTINWVCGSTS